MFVVVEFVKSAGGGLALVHEKWFTPRKKEVFRPPVKDNLIYNKLLSKGTEPEETKWNTFEISRFFFRSDNLDVAIKKLKEAEFTSDVNSDNNSSESCTSLLKPLSSNTDDISSNLVSPEKSTRAECEQTIHSQNYLILSEEPAEITETHNLRVPLIQHQGQHSSCGRNLDFQKKIISLLSILRQQNEDILSKLDKEKSVGAVGKPNLPVSLPVETNGDLLQLEDHLKSNDYAALCSYLASLGGKDVVSKTNKVLRTLITDELASIYSFYGKRNEKFAFVELTLLKCILRAIKLSNQTYKDTEIEHAVG